MKILKISSIIYFRFPNINEKLTKAVSYNKYSTLAFDPFNSHSINFGILFSYGKRVFVFCFEFPVSIYPTRNQDKSLLYRINMYYICVVCDLLLRF